ncbi:MAG: hypothetical protein KME08_17260 [Aphanothece sp. CMT-3BRIN-NPC111]|nr:hypothetical protein [Aphanothece sp. CMT-3BRIN-NPC111]
MLLKLSLQAPLSLPPLLTLGSLSISVAIAIYNHCCSVGSTFILHLTLVLVFLPTPSRGSCRLREQNPETSQRLPSIRFLRCDLKSSNASRSLSASTHPYKLSPAGSRLREQNLRTKSLKS